MSNFMSQQPSIVGNSLQFNANKTAAGVGTGSLI